MENAFIAYPDIRGAVIHSDRGTQYTSGLYRNTLRKYDIIQSMNSADGRCHDNARCESMWARLKTELLYDRYDSEKLTVSELKSLIWRYFGFLALIIRCRIYTALKEKAKELAKKPNYLTVPAAIGELEKIEMTRQLDKVYRLDHAVTKTQKVILSAFGMDWNHVKYRAENISKILKGVQ